MNAVTLVHYTSAPQMAQILRQRIIRSSNHQGFTKPQVSLCLVDTPFRPCWHVGESEQWWSKGKARVTVTLPADRVANWHQTISHPGLRDETVYRDENAKDWVVHEGDIDFDSLRSNSIHDPNQYGLVRAEILHNDQWLTIDLITLRGLLAGKTFPRRFR